MGMLIAFEGIDGTGKSTQVQLLAHFLEEQGFPVVTTYEPTDSEYGRRIRELYKDRSSCTPEEELNLFIEDRRLHVHEFIKPELAAGKIILTDRYYYSTAAYQGAAGMDTGEIFARNSFAPRPSLVLLLTMDPEVSIARIREGRGEELNDFEQLDQLRKVADHFAAFSDPCIARINAAQSPEQVHKDICRTVQERLF
ncbi:dTMP kinase [Candidatus Electrothrix sp.]|uniref:dTMP kinase n=1 Tax=Candidatus Electrothrix sp. TaxID=2170559 RepID=UPI0040576A07